MNKYLLMLLMVFSCSLCRVWGQFGNPTVFPPSPEAAALSRFADVPVSFYSGKPQIDIPMYTLVSGNISVPISISYYSSGIRVEDPSASVGMGWVLNSGGLISRAIRGGADDIGSNVNNGLPIAGSTTQADWVTITNLGATPNPSLEADIFYYNFAGYSGSFYIKGNKVLLKKAEDIKIDFIVQNLSFKGFVVTVKDGTKYYFDYQSSSAGAPAATEWYLTKIVDFNSTHSVNLEYRNDDNRFVVAPKNSKFYWFTTTLTTPHPIFNTPAVMWSWDSPGPVISKIYTSEHDSISFASKNLTYNETVTGVHTALDEMQVYNSQRERVKTFRFISNNIKTIKPYSIVGWGYPAVDNDYSVNYRLYLDGLSEVGENGSEIQHRFEYYGRTENGRDSLPSRLSCGQDRGGFYNGIDTNQTLIPTFHDVLNPMIVGIEYAGAAGTVDYQWPYDIVTIPGANRATDFAYMKMGMLKSITYPTGGKSEFYFSQQTFPATGEPYWGVKIDMIKYLDHNNNLLKKKSYEYSEGTSGHNIPPFLSYTHYSPDLGSISTFPGLSISGVGSPYYLTYKTAVEVSPVGKEDLGLFEGPTVGYGRVSELEDGIGATVYQFQNDNGYVETLSHNVRAINSGYHTTNLGLGDFWPLGPFPQDTWKRGTLLTKSVFSIGTSAPVQKTDYHYSFLVTDTIPAIKVMKVVDFGYYFFYQYDNLATFSRLDSITEINRGVTSRIVYEYNNPLYKQKTKETTYSSSQHTKSTEYKYPYDFLSTEPYATMVSRYSISAVIEEKTSYDGVYRELIKSSYGFFNGNSLIKPLEIKSQVFGRPLESRLLYNSYDRYGNLTSVSKPDGINTVYLYAYNGSYPILQVQNTDYTSLETALGGNYSVTLLSASNPDKANIDALVSTLHNSLPNAQVTSYVYKPLVGTTSATDAKGLSTYYEYDAFRRLMNTKDQNGNIVKSFNYHYRQL